MKPEQCQSFDSVGKRAKSDERRNRSLTLAQHHQLPNDGGNSAKGAFLLASHELERYQGTSRLPAPLSTRVQLDPPLDFDPH